MLNFVFVLTFLFESPNMLVSCLRLLMHTPHNKHKTFKEVSSVEQKFRRMCQKFDFD